ncbi:hypothetical protein LM602_00330 [Candidatus Acetothermia bacterium]|jgi:hypothetical protein|nr:hypothetical protein [Candidatus Acetothermia bacterium]MCI2436890.1 hypothetical protein [Candidatus Acetothermia bacterium]
MCNPNKRRRVLGTIKWGFTVGLALWIGQAFVVPGQTALQLEISATCENALLSVNGRLYSGRPFTLSVPLGSTVTLENLSNQLNNCGTQAVLHYFDRWEINGEPYSKALRPLRLRAGQPPFMGNSRVQLVFRSQTATLCDVAISAQDASGNFLSGAFVEVRPLDIAGDGDGVTPFVRTFDDLTHVILRASHQFSQGALNYQFARWQVEGGQLLPTFTADPTVLRVRCSPPRTFVRVIYELRAATLSCPDLTLYRLEFSFTNLGPNAWLFSPIAVVKNIGATQVSVPSITSFLLNGRPIAEVTTAPLPPDATQQASTTLLLPDGNYLVTAIADSKNQVAECNEDNNIREIFVRLPPN